ncbi:Fc receptor-like protein 5 isoform X2 [Pempheris klunzingeri]|uniref:Fc receptor-like protein 5 isoform X2 n=1 Tax=Pempheris klunzingeri TaxID=3127111 RepID=UPI00398050F2
MQLTPFCLLLSCLRVSPDRSQFFRYNSISLSCEDQLNSTSWKVKRKTPEGGVRPCGSGWGFVSSGSTCIIRSTYPTDTGVYWCESEDGEMSNGVNITITDRRVLLETPALPVSVGAAVTLHCKAETSSPNHTFNYYRDGQHIGSTPTGELSIRRASKTDEGLYECGITGGEESRGSWLAVDAPSSAPPPAPSSAPSAASGWASVSRLMCHLVVGTPYLLSTVLLGLVYRDRKRARPAAERRGSNDVIMEIVV